MNTYPFSTSKLSACLLENLLQIKKEAGGVMSFAADPSSLNAWLRAGQGSEPAGGWASYPDTAKAE